MKKSLLFLLLFTILFSFLVTKYYTGWCPWRKELIYSKTEGKKDTFLSNALNLLRARRDKEALAGFEQILLAEPDNLLALWGKAEVLRRQRNYKESEFILNGILNKNLEHPPSLISLAYIRYKEDRLNAALNLIQQVLGLQGLEREDKALAYMMLGSINSRRSARGWLFNKIRYGIKIKGYFLKAKLLAPDLPEVHLGLGTFYLLAPAIVGGNLGKAFEELESTVKIAPEFATANARLAQYYKRIGNLEKYNFYLQRAKALDPQNEVVSEESRN